MSRVTLCFKLGEHSADRRIARRSKRRSRTSLLKHLRQGKQNIHDFALAAAQLFIGGGDPIVNALSLLMLQT
jgi:hypothetical protein